MDLFAEPWVRALIRHMANGDSFYMAIVLLTAAGLMPAARRRRRLGRGLIVAIGLVLLAFTLASLTIWWAMYLILILAVALSRPRRRRPTFIAMLLVLLIASAMAYRYETRTVRLDRPGPLIVYGDSLATAFNVEASVIWPELLGEKLGRDVLNRASAGYGVADVAKLLDRDAPQASVVICEVGGNDTLGSTPIRQYARDLNALLARLMEKGNQLIVLEVPAPPSAPWYAWTQRYLVWRHGAALLPKRTLLKAIFAPGKSTVDDLHLSQIGHQALADELADRIKE